MSYIMKASLNMVLSFHLMPDQKRGRHYEI